MRDRSAEHWLGLLQFFPFEPRGVRRSGRWQEAIRNTPGRRPALRFLVPPSCVHSLEKLRRDEAQRLVEPGDILDSGIAQAAIDAADVGGVETGLFGQLFLGELSGFALAVDTQSSRREFHCVSA